jgi:hypothetical protein
VFKELPAGQIASEKVPVQSTAPTGHRCPCAVEMHCAFSPSASTYPSLSRSCPHTQFPVDAYTPEERIEKNRIPKETE